MITASTRRMLDSKVSSSDSRTFNCSWNSRLKTCVSFRDKSQLKRRRDDDSIDVSPKRPPKYIKSYAFGESLSTRFTYHYKKKIMFSRTKWQKKTSNTSNLAKLAPENIRPPPSNAIYYYTGKKKRARTNRGPGGSRGVMGFSTAAWHANPSRAIPRRPRAKRGRGRLLL